MSSDVGELSEETEDGVLALVKGTLIDDTEGLLRFSDHLLGDFGKLGESEEDNDGCSETRNGEVSVLKTSKRLLLTVTVESLGCNQRTDEGSQTVGGLCDVEAESSMLSVAEDSDVGVGHGFERSKSASNDERREGETEVFGVVSGGPESEGSAAVEGQAEEDTVLVTESRGEHGSNRGEDDVGTEICDLNHGRLQVRDGEGRLDLLVEYIDQTV